MISLDSLPSPNDSDPFSTIAETGHNSAPSPLITAHAHCPIVVPPGPLFAAGAFESDMSAVEELRLLKAQVSDIARVCNAVARGDLCQKVTVPVQGVVMVQLKDVVNTMVYFDSYSYPMASSQKKRVFRWTD